MPHARVTTRLLAGAALVLALLGPRGGAAEPPPDRELDTLWADLARKDPVKAHQAIAALVARPAQTVPFLQSKLRPVAAADPRRLARLIEDLDSSRFAVRRRATQELEQVGEPAAALLRQALAGRPSLEVRRHIERLLEAQKTHRLHPPPDQLRLARVVEVLEQIGNPEAGKVLASLAQGAPEALLTCDAQGADAKRAGL